MTGSNLFITSSFSILACLFQHLAEILKIKLQSYPVSTFLASLHANISMYRRFLFKFFNSFVINYVYRFYDAFQLPALPVLIKHKAAAVGSLEPAVTLCFYLLFIKRTTCRFPSMSTICCTSHLLLHIYVFESAGYDLSEACGSL